MTPDTPAATGPNDFHFVEVNGKLVQMPGLGEFQPSVKAATEAAQAAEQIRQKEEALATAEAAVRNEARALETRAQEQSHLEEERAAAFEAKMRDLEAREQALLERETAPDPTSDTPPDSKPAK